MRIRATRPRCTVPAPWLFALFALWLGMGAAAQVPVPEPSARVTDLTGTLSAEQRRTLEARLADLEARKGTQIAVLLVPTTQPEPVEAYARRVLDAWKLGRKGVDDGALLLVAVNDRKLRIEVQYGLEGALPDATAKRIVDEIVVPRFRQQDFFGGIAAGVERMIGIVDGEPLPPPVASRDTRGSAEASRFESLLMVGFVLVFVAGAALRAIFGRFGGALIAGGVGGVIAYFVVGSLLAAVVLAILVFVLNGIVGLGGGSALRRGARGGWSGGSWGGGGGWSGGGWSGGGGSGGGGGASGSW